RDDKLIGFDLREVWIDCEIDGYSGARDELRSQSRIERDWLVHDAPRIESSCGRRERRDKPAVLRNRQTRNQFDGALDGDSFETCQMSGLTQITVDTARKRHPRIELVFKTFDAAKEMRAPKFAFACLESQRLERDRDLDVETGLVNDTFRFHQQIDAEVFAATFG